MKRPLLALAALLLIAACTQRAPTGAPVGPPAGFKTSPPLSADSEIIPKGAIPPGTPALKVALLVPLSGESAAVGNAMLDAATLALYDTYLTVPSSNIRAQILLLPQDAGNTPAMATKAAQQAIDQGAVFIIGPLFSQAVTAVAPLARKAGVPMLTFSNNRSVAEKNIYTFGFLPEQQVARMAEYAYLHKFTRVAVLAPNDAYGEKVKDALMENFAAKGGVASPSELYAPSPTNIDAAVSRVASTYGNMPEERRFQGIFIADGGYQLKNIIASMKKTAFELQQIKLLGTGLWDDPEIVKIPEMHGAWFPGSPPASYRRFEHRFVSTYGYKPIRLASLAYDAVALAAQLTLSNPDALSSGALVDPKGYISPANGLFRLRPDGTSERMLDIMQITPDGFEVIDPAPRTFR